ncbi:c1521ccf-5b64-49b4-8f23-e7a82f13f6cf [Sclerotinia trifoliorum]|uniref:C1521ccf-5b64-49b4-8f23-e7a82f13f6cf n=1 Tax=Sclerotinia trifoliorum TaxID=28548 RepID=A0A8H2VQ59_9HELO|nr:c1521ccf-5b64-49b4-8f23-e7a82f13f6cf [Sclerotinia trifoliorum]
MSYHGSWGRSTYDRTAHRTNGQFPSATRARSKPSSIDGPSTPTRGWSNSNHKTFNRSKPIVTSALRCLVGKFEAMDALSLPIQDPTLQPAPLHSARNSPRKRSRTRDSSQKRLSTILSPTSRGLSKDESVFLDEYLRNNTWGDTPSSTKSMMLRSQNRQFQSRRLKTPQQLVKAIKTPSKSENRNISSRSTSKHRNTTKVETPAYAIPKKSPNKKIGNMIKDRIRFFDGSPDEIFPSSPLKTSPPKTGPSKLAPNHDLHHQNVESSPTSYKTVIETQNPAYKGAAAGSVNFSRTSELAREKNIFSTPAKSQYSPPASRKQRKFFGEAIQNPFLASQESSEKTRSSITISPHTLPTKPHLFCRLNSETKVDLSPRGSSLARYEVNTTPTRNFDAPKISRPRGRTIPGRKDPKTGIQKDVDSRRNQINEKIEAIYQAKAEARKAQNQEKITLQECYEVSPMPKNDGKEDDVRKPQRIKDTTSFRSKSKVADMRLRFDGGASFASTVLPGSASKDADRGTVSPIKDWGVPSVIPTPPPAPPPPVFSSRLCRKGIITPKHHLPLSVPPSKTPKSPSPRKQTLSEMLVQRVSTLPLETPERVAIPGRLQTPKGKPHMIDVGASPILSQLGKSAIKTWPRSGIKKPKQIRNGLIAEKLKMFEEISRKNDDGVSPGKGKNKDSDSSRQVANGRIARTLVDGRKECFEMSPARDGEDRNINPIFPSVIIAREKWQGKEKEKEKGEQKVEDRADAIEVIDQISPPTKTRPQSREPRIENRQHVVGRWNEVSGMNQGEGEGDILGHLPIKRGLRCRMHTGGMD